MPEVAFVTSPGQDWAVRELVETVGYELGLQGVPSSVHTDGFPEPRPGLVYVLAGLRQFLELEGEEGLADRSVLARTVMLGDEPPSRAAHGERYQELLRCFGVVFDTHLRSVMALHRVGIPARTLRPGYSAPRDRFDADVRRPIDVVFTGTANPRRRQLLGAYAPIFSRYNCLIQLADGAYPNPVGSPSFLARERLDLLAQAKVVVDLHQHDDAEGVDWSRALDGFHTGAVLVAEPNAGWAPFDPGQHLLIARPEALGFVVEAILEDTERQQAIRLAAYERLSRWLPYGLSIGVLRAALVELVGRPIPAGAPLGRPLRSRVEPVGRWNPREDATSAPDLGRDGAGLRAVLADQRRAHRRERDALLSEMADLRSRVVELQSSFAAESAEPRVSIEFESPAWSAVRDVTASVLMGLEGEPDAVLASLEAVARTRRGGFEVILAGCNGPGLSVAVRWGGAHPRLPMRVLSLAGANLLGRARNAALDHARGEALMVLAPGDRPVPRALDVLLGTLVPQPGVDLVYPLSVTGDAAATVVSYFGWEPSRLRLENFVSSPYLIRRRTLADRGGFSVDPTLAGWEDYDLFCRLAEHGVGAQMVPQLLAWVDAGRQRESLVGDPVRGARLSRRAPRLLAGLAELSAD